MTQSYIIIHYKNSSQILIKHNYLIMKLSTYIVTFFEGEFLLKDQQKLQIWKIRVEC